MHDVRFVKILNHVYNKTPDITVGRFWRTKLFSRFGDAVKYEKRSMSRHPLLKP